MKLSVSEALARLAETHSDYQRFVEKRGFDVGLYRPENTDPQSPHSRDEVYIVASGCGNFTCEGETKAFGPGDMLCVPAGLAHRFTGFSADFATWVVFFGERSPRFF
jgi:mannose-6-phosphate isomerase-like protein (cupin superfamily)